MDPRCLSQPAGRVCSEQGNRKLLELTIAGGVIDRVGVPDVMIDTHSAVAAPVGAVVRGRLGEGSCAIPWII